MRIGRILGIAAGVLLVVALAAAFWVGANLEEFLNRVQPVALPSVSAQARALHAAAFVADMHADTLMLRGDLTVRSRTGHVDLPRLQEGGVALQFFTAVTKVPLGLNIESNDSDSLDLLTLVGLVRFTPFATRDLLGRALLYSERLHDSIARANGHLLPVRSVAELDQLIARRAEDPTVVGALLGSEGAHPLLRRPGQRRSPVQGRLPHDRPGALLRQRLQRLGARPREVRADRQGPRSRAAHGEARHARRSGARRTGGDRRRAGDGDQAGRGVAHRRARHLRQPAATSPTTTCAASPAPAASSASAIGTPPCAAPT